MAKATPVYACPNANGDKLRFCAAPSLRKAARCIGIPYSVMLDNGFETARYEDVEIALWRPWAAFERPRHNTDPKGYIEISGEAAQ